MLLGEVRLTAEVARPRSRYHAALEQVGIAEKMQSYGPPSSLALVSAERARPTLAFCLWIVMSWEVGKLEVLRS